MADRKQGAGLSSGSSAAVHKANYDPKVKGFHLCCQGQASSGIRYVVGFTLL